MVEQGDSSDPPIDNLSPSALLMVKSNHLPFVRHTCRAYTHPHTHAHAHTHIYVSISQQICFRLITVSEALKPPRQDTILHLYQLY